MAGVAEPATPAPLREPAFPESRLAVPMFVDSVARSDIEQRLAELVPTKASVVVEGLSGTGKTFAVADFVTCKQLRSLYQAVLWFEPDEGITLDDLFLQLSDTFNFSAGSERSRARELAHLLKASRTLLVIDDYSKVDAASFSMLIDSCVRVGPPATLIVITNMAVDLEPAPSSTGHCLVGGLNRHEIVALFARFRIQSVDEQVIQALLRKTDGLPFAVALCAALVAYQGRDPMELLEGDFLIHDRCRHWFNALVSGLAPEALRLLAHLSLCDEPFNRGFVRAAAMAIRLTEWEAAFDKLQGYYLVQRYSAHRSRVHALIAALCHPLLTESERSDGHVTIAAHYTRGLSTRRGQIVSSDDFACMAKGCRHYQLAHCQRKAEELLHVMSSTAKARGFYSIFTRLAVVTLESGGDYDPWLEYHLAHCALVTGQIARAHRYAERLLLNTTESEITRRLQVSRLYAEILLEIGKKADALRVVRQALTSVEGQAASSTALAHSRSVFAGALTENARYAEAEKVCQELLREAEARGDERGAAVALTRWGIVDWKQDRLHDARPRLESAVELFRRGADRRGEGWALLYLGAAEIKLGWLKAATEHIRNAIAIHEDIGAYSRSYSEVLSTLSPFEGHKQLRLDIDNEIRRVQSMRPNSETGLEGSSG